MAQCEIWCGLLWPSVAFCGKSIRGRWRRLWSLYKNFRYPNIGVNKKWVSNWENIGPKWPNVKYDVAFCGLLWQKYARKAAEIWSLYKKCDGGGHFLLCCKTSFFLWHGFHHGAGLGTSILATLGYATSRNGGGGGFTAMRRAGRAARRRCCRPFCLWPPKHIGSKYFIFVPKLYIPSTLNTFIFWHPQRIEAAINY